MDSDVTQRGEVDGSPEQGQERPGGWGAHRGDLGLLLACTPPLLPVPGPADKGNRRAPTPPALPTVGRELLP